MIKIAINGFGRIGRTFLRVLLSDKRALQNIQVVAINIGPAEIDSTAHFFKYDTLMGVFPDPVLQKGDILTIGSNQIKIISESNPEQCPWQKLSIDWVVDCSGQFTERKKAQLHLDAGARSVLISAPGKNMDITIIPGVNDKEYDAEKHRVVSLGSCTTNAFLPLLKVLQDSFGIEKGFMTTVHAYTNSQVLLDVDAKDVRRARSATLNIIPTSTGASEVMGLLMPELEGKIISMALRVPVPKGSLIDLTFIAKKEITKDLINNAFSNASKANLKSILAITNDPIVSSDSNMTTYSVIVDGLLTEATGNLGKVFGWYDNEWGYSERLKDFLLINGQK